ncbi:LacI family DNA-binding transcriptional regulator [Microbacter sp. GSS18]|nr:LacI family DNA-binding transcriptional regulator [Microbacter sp. GSS18]
MTRRPTLKDVAERAGVSVSAVSYALNDKSTVPLAEATKERIRAAADDIGYVPNRIARSLQARASGAIGVILDKPLTLPRYAGIVQGLGAGLSEAGLHLTLVSGVGIDSALEDARGGLLAGLVFIGHDDLSAPAELVARVRKHGIPFAALDCGDPEAPYPSVDFDYAHGVRQMIEHFEGPGIDHLVYVRPDLGSRAEVQRESALTGELASRPRIDLTVLSDGITAERLQSYDADPGSAAGHVTALAASIENTLRDSGASPGRTAVLCAWGADAEAAYRAARAVGGGIRVGSLAAGSLALELWPDLAYSRLPLEAAGRACAGLIAAAAAGRAEPEHLLLTPTLGASSVSNPLRSTGGPA